MLHLHVHEQGNWYLILLPFLNLEHRLAFLQKEIYPEPFVTNNTFCYSKCTCILKIVIIF